MNGSELGRYYTIALLIAAFLGSKVLAINIGVQLSIYRILLILSPIIIAICPRPKEGINITRPYTKFLKVWLIYSIILLPVIKDYSAWGHNLFFLVSAFLTSYMAGRYLNKREDVMIILVGFVCVMLVDACIGVQEMMTGVYSYIPENSIDYYDTRSALESTIGVRVPISVAGNPNDFGMMMVFAFIASATLAAIIEKRTLKLLCVLFSLFFVFMVVASQSRSQFISLLIGIILLMYNKYKKQSRNIKILIWSLFLLFGSYIVGVVIENQDLFKALLEIDISGNESDSVRWNLILNGFSILSKSLFLGVGIGNIEYHMAQPGLLSTNGIVNIHNWWLEILVSSGVFIFIIYCSFYIRTLRNFWLRTKLFLKKERMCYALSNCGLTSMIVFVLSSMGSSSIFATEWWWAYFVLLFSFNIIFNKQNI